MTFWEESDKRLKENKGETAELLTVNYQNLPFVVSSMAFTAFGFGFFFAKYKSWCNIKPQFSITPHFIFWFGVLFLNWEK